MHRRTIIAATIALSALTGFAGECYSRELTLENRVTAQRAIEEVYWKHRVWPKDNRDGRPSFESTISLNVLREKVSVPLRETILLERVWGESIAPEQLQAELDRMASRTRASSARGGRRPPMHSRSWMPTNRRRGI